jgi:hypothetical protein
MVDKNSVVDRNSIKLVDESSVVVENTGLKLEEVDEKTAVYQSVFSLELSLCPSRAQYKNQQINEN